MRLRPRRFLAALVAVVGLVLAGCAGVPTQGGQDVLRAPVDAAETFVHVRVPAPAPGLDPQDVVQRFLAASAEFDEGFRTAREYLSSDAQAAWAPLAGTTVVDRLSLVVQQATSPDQVLQGQVLGRIDADGRYVERAVPQPVQVRFRVEQERAGASAGQWRIAAMSVTVATGHTVAGGWTALTLADGLVLDQATVSTALAELDVQWLGANGTRLVPEPVLLPRGTGDLAQGLLRRFAAGPGSWLAGAVRTALPSGAQPQVKVLGHDAQVSVDGLGTLSSADHGELAAQLAATLEDPDLGIDRVTLVSDGGTEDISASAAALAPSPPRQAQLLTVDTGGRVWLVPASPKGKPTRWRALPSAGLRHPTTAPAGVSPRTSAAVVAGSRPSLLLAQPDGRERLVYRSAHGPDALAAPSFDATGTLWSADLPVGTLLVVPSGGSRLRTLRVDLVRVAALLGVRAVTLTAVEPAPDGARVALAVTFGSGTNAESRVLVAPVHWQGGTSGGTPQLGALRPVAPAALAGDDILALDWAQPSGPMVLLAQDSGNVVQQLPVGEVAPGSAQPAPLAEELAVSADNPPVVVVESHRPDRARDELSRLQQPPFRAGLRDPEFLR